MDMPALRQSIIYILAGGTALAVVPEDSTAAGFAVPDISIAGIGNANALVANPKELGAVPYNPATMAFHDGSSLSAGAVLISPALTVTTASGSHDGNASDLITIPALQGVFKASEHWAVGLRAGSDFGLEGDYALGTFPALSSAYPSGNPATPFPAGTFHPAGSKLDLATITPTLAYRCNDNLGLSFGLDYYGLRKFVLDTHGLGMRGKEGDGWGWNLSAMFTTGPWSLGASFHSTATVAGEGDLRVSDPSLASLGLTDQRITADMNLPWRLQLGVRYAFSERLAAEFDFSRTGWSEFDRVEFRAADTGAMVLVSTNDWNDSDAYRLGLTYDLSGRTRLRLGYARDTAAHSHDHFSAKIPDNDYQVFAAGLAHGFGTGWEVEAGYAYVLFDDNDYRGSRPFDPSVDPDPNGTSGYDGRYESHMHIFGIGVNWRFD